MNTDGNGDGPNERDWIKDLAAQRPARAWPGLTPRGRSVSSALVLPPGVLPRDRRLRALLATIDAVHGDGDLPRIPIRWGVLPGDVVAQYRTTDDFTQTVSLTIDPNRSRWPLAMIHEIGHVIDHRGIDEPLTMASRTSPLLSHWRQAVGESRAYCTLIDDFGTVPYLTDEDEVWARSYAQWIASRSGDESLITLVVQSKGVDPRLPRFFGQWDDDDFVAIADQITQLFQRLGWTD